MPAAYGQAKASGRQYSQPTHTPHTPTATQPGLPQLRQLRVLRVQLRTRTSHPPQPGEGGQSALHEAEAQQSGRGGAVPGSAQVAAGRARPFVTTALAAPHPVVLIAQPVATAHEAAERASIAEAASQTAADSTEAETAVVGRQRSEHGRAASGARCDRRGSSPAGCRGRTVPHHRQTGSYHRKPLQRAAAGASVVAGSATQGTLQLGPRDGRTASPGGGVGGIGNSSTDAARLASHT